MGSCVGASSDLMTRLNVRLCDEGSAYWLGRLGLRSVLLQADRCSSNQVYSAPAQTLLALHQDLLNFFGASAPADLVGITSISGPYTMGLSAERAITKRNALIAGSARILIDWAFDEDHVTKTPDRYSEYPVEILRRSQQEALRLVRHSASCVARMIGELLGDGGVIIPQETVLCLGGGLMKSAGYSQQVFEQLGLPRESFHKVIEVEDAALEGAQLLARIA
jgi:N-acetylglucosamine kinase-like BadF-type ATPase